MLIKRILRFRSETLPLWGKLDGGITVETTYHFRGINLVYSTRKVACFVRHLLSQNGAMNLRGKKQHDATRIFDGGCRNSGIGGIGEQFTGDSRDNGAEDSAALWRRARLVVSKALWTVCALGFVCHSRLARAGTMALQSAARRICQIGGSNGIR